jgi:hypothetical protein
MRIKHPSDLARTIRSKGTRRNFGPLPALSILTEILELAFYSSLETEEGRELHFGLCCVKKGTPLRMHDNRDATPRIIRLKRPIKLSVDALRKFAPAVSPHLAYILIEWGTGSSKLTINGIVHLGPSWDLARKGFTDTTDGPPDTLLLDVKGRGRIKASFGPYQLTELVGGKLVQATTSLFLPLDDVNALIIPGLKAMTGLKGVKELTDALLVYTETLCSIFNGIEGRRHGGTVLLCSPKWMEANSATFLKSKYHLKEGTLLREAFADYVTRRIHLLQDRLDERPTFSQRSAALSDDPQASSLRRALNAASLTIAELASVDGALLLSSDFTCYGFGCEILTAKTKPVTAWPVNEKGVIGELPIDSEERGMRHRSALRLCGAAPGSSLVAFVCSQDGGISMIYRGAKRKTLVRKIVPLSYAFSF